MADKVNLTEEKEVLSAEEVLAKIKRLDGYIRKTEKRIELHEKALVKLRAKMKKEISKTMQSVIKGKHYG